MGNRSSVGGLAALVAVVLLLGFTRSAPRVTPPAVLPVPPSATSTVQGEFTCLPHRNTSGPQTLECAFGLQADSGDYYALDLSAVAPDASAYPMGEYYTVRGLITPVEALSSDFWQKYNIRGIIRVAEIL